MFVIAITIWPSNARITRAQTLSIKNRVFVRAARISGASDNRILFNHILPNGIYPVIVNSTIQMGNAVVTEASFTNDLGADSLDTVELIMEFEKEFNIAIPDDQAENIGTVGEAIKYLENNAK